MKISSYVIILSILYGMNVKAESLRSLDELVNTLVMQEIRLVGIGETHTEKNRKMLYQVLLPKLKDYLEKPICLLMEIPEGDNRPFLDGWPAKEALAMNIAVFGVDKPFDERHYNAVEYPIESFNERDRYMADKIGLLFNRGLCRSALLINGAKHYQTFAESRVSLKSLLQSSFSPQAHLHFIKRKDDDFFREEGATEWKWSNKQYKEFDSILFGK